MKDQKISESEYEILKIIWNHGGQAYYVDIADALVLMQITWKKNTVLTFLSRLVEKKMVKAFKQGQKNLYVALLNEDAYQTLQIKSFIGRVYEGNAKGLVNTLLQQDLITQDDLEELHDFWDMRKQQK